MLKIKEYKQVASLQEAYEENQKKGAVILGGMLWLKLQDKNVSTAIDLSGLGLDTIEENDEEFRIGAMVTLRQLEQHPGLNRYTKNMMKEAVKHIVGVQFRNCATVGGSIFGRFGFSDVLTLFLVLDSYVNLYQAGQVSMEDFAASGAKGDVLSHIIIKKQPMDVAYQCQRNTKTDFPTLTCAVARQGEEYRCAIGARPGRAVTFTDPEGILKAGITSQTAQDFGAYIANQVVVGSNMRASGEYRRKIAGVLVKRAVLAMEE